MFRILTTYVSYTYHLCFVYLPLMFRILTPYHVFLDTSREPHRSSCNRRSLHGGRLPLGIQQLDPVRRQQHNEHTGVGGDEILCTQSALSYILSTTRCQLAVLRGLLGLDRVEKKLLERLRACGTYVATSHLKYFKPKRILHSSGECVELGLLVTWSSGR